mmetsp:Transcript_13867/g.34156  ORF Transcript_13867/g.34156 Transcript_13867/m.34156 type:complete len:202 (+) Transcript_13867:771-1376(+)
MSSALRIATTSGSPAAYCCSSLYRMYIDVAGPIHSRACWPPLNQNTGRSPPSPPARMVRPTSVWSPVSDWPMLSKNFALAPLGAPLASALVASTISAYVWYDSNHVSSTTPATAAGAAAIAARSWSTRRCTSSMSTSYAKCAAASRLRSAAPSAASAAGSRTCTVLLMRTSPESGCQMSRPSSSSAVAAFFTTPDTTWWPS